MLLIEIFHLLINLILSLLQLIIVIFKFIVKKITPLLHRFVTVLFQKNKIVFLLKDMIRVITTNKNYRQSDYNLYF